MQLSRLLTEPDGEKASVTRVVFFVWSVGVLVMWVLACLKRADGTLAPIDSGVATLLGVLMTGKVIQRHVEGQPPTKPPAAK